MRTVYWSHPFINYTTLHLLKTVHSLNKVTIQYKFLANQLISTTGSARSDLVILGNFLDLFCRFSQYLLLFQKITIYQFNHNHYEKNKIFLIIQVSQFLEVCKCVRQNLCAPKILFWKISSETAGGN